MCPLEPSWPGTMLTKWTALRVKFCTATVGQRNAAEDYYKPIMSLFSGETPWNRDVGFFFISGKETRKSHSKLQTAKSTAHTLGWTDYGSFKNPCNALSVIRPDIFVTFPRHGLSLDKSSLFGPFGISARWKNFSELFSLLLHWRMKVTRGFPLISSFTLCL